MDQHAKTQLKNSLDAHAMESWSWIEPGWRAFQHNDKDKALRLWEKALLKRPNDLLLQRAINKDAPHMLSLSHVRLRRAPRGAKVAIIFPGELRCIASSSTFIKSLSKLADLFICTSEDYREIALQFPAVMSFLGPEPDLPMGSMQQWHKLSVCLEMVRERELLINRRYTHIIKLRSDFHHVKPSHLLHEVTMADGLICASDKVFGGSRDLMMLFQGFYSAISGWFDKKELHYWPINTIPILRSDDSSKWYGMTFPKDLIGQPSTVDELRELLTKGGESLANKLQIWKPPNNIYSKDHYWQLFQGHPRFASEVCFARFLNFNAINSHSSPSMLGFLRSDRVKL